MNEEYSPAKFKKIILLCDTCKQEVGTWKFFPYYLELYNNQLKIHSNFYCSNCIIAESEKKRELVKQVSKEKVKLKKLDIW